MDRFIYIMFWSRFIPFIRCNSMLYHFYLLNASAIGRFAVFPVHVSCSAVFTDLGVEESRSRGIW